LVETAWVLTRVYGVPHARFVPILLALFNTRELIFQDFETVNAAFALYAQNPKTDFADALIVEAAKHAGATETVTFDEQAAIALGMTLLK
jgi:predicted nucleic-acid-binding protein